MSEKNKKKFDNRSLLQKSYDAMSRDFRRARDSFDNSRLDAQFEKMRRAQDENLRAFERTWGGRRVKKEEE